MRHLPGQSRLNALYLWPYRRARRNAWMWFAATGLMLLVVLTSHNLAHARVHHDCALYLQCGQLILEGQLPFVDIVDTNPPWIMYLSTLPAGIAGLLSIPVTLAFSLSVSALVVLSVAQLHYVLCRARTPLSPAEKGVLVLAFVVACSAALFRREFGQREHLFVLLYLPFLLVRWVRHDGQRLPTWFTVLVGLQAGVGACMKPHFIVIAAAVEMCFVLAHRALRPLGTPEIFAVLAVGFGYAIHWCFVPAEMRQSFFGRWVPFIISHYGESYGRSHAAILRKVLTTYGGGYGGGFYALGVLVSAWVAIRSRLSLGRLLMGVVAFSFASFAMFLHQRKGYTYQLLPFTMGAVLTLAVLLVECRRLIAPSRPLRKLRADLVLVPFLCALIAGTVGLAVLVDKGHKLTRTHLSPEPLVNAVKQHSVPGDGILVLSTSVDPQYPLLTQLRRRPGSRYLWCFPLALLYPRGASDKGPQSPMYRSPDNAPEEERRFIAELSEDIRVRAPRVIAVRDWDDCLGCRAGFNLYRYMEHVGLIRDVIAGRYTQVETDSEWRVYVIRQQQETPERDAPSTCLDDRSRHGGNAEAREN